MRRPTRRARENVDVGCDFVFGYCRLYYYIIHCISMRESASVRLYSQLTLGAAMMGDKCVSMTR